MLPDPSSAESIGWIALALAAAATASNQVEAFIRRRSGAKEETTIGPQPLTVRADSEWVPKQAFEAHVADVRRTHEQLFAKLGGVERGLREELKSDVAALHEKINDAVVAIARVETENRSQGQILARIYDEVRGLMARKP